MGSSLSRRRKAATEYVPTAKSLLEDGEQVPFAAEEILTAKILFLPALSVTVPASCPENLVLTRTLSFSDFSLP